MSWIWLSIASAIVLGIYELLKKLAVRDNAVPPVLFGSLSDPQDVIAPEMPQGIERK